MEKKFRAGVLGATGMVGQKYLSLLEGHPWFDVTYLAASPSSAGKTYGQAVEGRWHMLTDMPKGLAGIVVQDASDVEAAVDKCDFVFSAVELNNKEATKKLEIDYAKAGIPVVSNDSAHRWTTDVPMLIPEINADHLKVIVAQQAHYGFDKGFIVVKPNCSIQSYMLPVHALMKAGYPIKALSIVTMQAVSGAGIPGVSAYHIDDNIIPFIGGEEEKTEREPAKIFGNVIDGKIANHEGMRISAHCNRVPVVDGHTACVSLMFSDKRPMELEHIVQIWNTYSGPPQDLKLPSAPKQPIIYRSENNRPQPRKDRDTSNGMVVTVGRLRDDSSGLFDIKFVGLSHNTVRGAAGGGILNAELLVAKGYLG